jgi:hypothetical protein
MVGLLPMYFQLTINNQQQTNEARYANWQSGQAQTLVDVGSNPSRATSECRANAFGRAVGRQAVCKTAAFMAMWVRFPPEAMDLVVGGWWLVVGKLI